MYASAPDDCAWRDVTEHTVIKPQAGMQPLESWEATVEEFLALQSILQSFQCWLSDTELQLTPEEADRLIQEGPQGRQLSCVASVHIAVPEGGLAVKVRLLLPEFIDWGPETPSCRS